MIAPRGTPLLLLPFPFPFPLLPPLLPPEPEVAVAEAEAGAVGVMTPLGAAEIHDAWALAAAAELAGIGEASVALPLKLHD